jgi:gliding motility-associated-like protein
VDEVVANFGWSVPCVGTPFTLIDSSTALYTAPSASSWYFGGGDTAAGSPASYSFATSGIHPVTLVAGNATGCRDTITKDVFINPLPIIMASDDTGVCPNVKIRLLVVGGSSYTWSPAPDSMNNCPVCDIAFVHLDSAAGGTYKVYTVTGTDSKGCVNKDSVRVSIQLRTEYSTGDGGEICVGESFRLHAEGAQKYEWLPAATLDSPFIASPLARPQQTTSYIVAAREGSCDIDSQTVTVVVHSLPLFSAGNDETISLGSAVTLKPTRIGISRIEWAPDTSLTCLNCFDPAAHPHYTRTYYATGYNEYGCAATDSVTVHVRCNGSLVFIPNTFTPNNDGLNDYFFPRGDGIERMSVFRIYNRWGELVFERSNALLNDERSGWDGSYKGKALAPDVYMYMMQSTCSSGDILEWKGDVTIMR